VQHRQQYRCKRNGGRFKCRANFTWEGDCLDGNYVHSTSCKEAAARKLAQQDVRDDAARLVRTGRWKDVSTLMVASNKKEIIADSFARSNPNAALLLSLAHDQGFKVKAKADPREGKNSVPIQRPVPRANTGKLIALGKRRQEAVTWKEASCFKRFKEDPTYRASPVLSVCSPIPAS